jgi:hypothetical protein
MSELESFSDEQAPKQGAIPLELVPHIARRARTKLSLDTFNAVVETALDMGMTSTQKLSQVFGRDLVRTLQSPKSNPNPAQCREVLAYIASLDPDEATGQKEQWRHEAKPRSYTPFIYPR